MKKYLLGAAAALAVGAPSAYADTSGHVDFSYQTANIDWGGGSEDDIDYWDLGGAVVTPLHDGWNLELSANHSNYTWDGSDWDGAATAVSLHAFYRNDSYGLGGYAGFGGIWGATAYMVGGEGQMYLPNATLTGAIQWANTSDYWDYSAWDMRVGGSYFFNDDFAVNGTISYTEFDDYDTNATGIGIGAEYRFAGSAFSINGSYLNESWDYGSSDADADVFRIGGSWDFGTGSLKERSQEGASFDSARPFIDVWTRWD